LCEWAHAIENSIARTPYTPQGESRFEFYIPERAKRNAPQFKRWSTMIDDITGTYLARRGRVYGMREYRLVDIEGGRVVRSGEMPIGDVRRYMYAIDERTGNVITARVTEFNNQVQVVLHSELPRAEQRLLSAIGTLSIPEDKPYLRCWTFSRSWHIAIDCLARLHINTSLSATSRMRG